MSVLKYHWKKKQTNKEKKESKNIVLWSIAKVNINLDVLRVAQIDQLMCDIYRVFMYSISRITKGCSQFHQFFFLCSMSNISDLFTCED